MIEVREFFLDQEQTTIRVPRKHRVLDARMSYGTCVVAVLYDPQCWGTSKIGVGDVRPSGIKIQGSPRDNKNLLFISPINVKSCPPDHPYRRLSLKDIGSYVGQFDWEHGNGYVFTARNKNAIRIMSNE